MLRMQMVLGIVCIATCIVLTRGAVVSDREGPGPLVIAGGALRDDNGAVWRAFVAEAEAHERAHPDGRLLIAVLPTASGREDAGEGARDVILKHVPGAMVEIVQVRTFIEGSADDPDLAAVIRDADGIWFTGGDQSRIVEAFRPPSTGLEQSLADLALREAHERGAVVGGTSAGAAMMSDPMIAGGGNSAEMLRSMLDLRGEGEFWTPVSPGIGLLDHGLVDQHFFERDRILRLIVAIDEQRRRWGMGIGENSAVLVRRESRFTINVEALSDSRHTSAVLIIFADDDAPGAAVPLWNGVMRCSLLLRGSMKISTHRRIEQPDREITDEEWSRCFEVIKDVVAPEGHSNVMQSDVGYVICGREIASQVYGFQRFRLTRIVGDPSTARGIHQIHNMLIHLEPSNVTRRER